MGVLVPAKVTIFHLFISLTSSSWLTAPLMRLTCGGNASKQVLVWGLQQVHK